GVLGKTLNERGRHHVEAVGLKGFEQQHSVDGRASHERHGKLPFSPRQSLDIITVTLHFQFCDYGGLPGPVDFSHNAVCNWYTLIRAEGFLRVADATHDLEL